MWRSLRRSGSAYVRRLLLLVASLDLRVRDLGRLCHLVGRGLGQQLRLGTAAEQLARHAGALELGVDLGLVDAARRLAGEGVRKALLDGRIHGARLHRHAQVLGPRPQLGVVGERLDCAGAQGDPLLGARLGIGRLEREPGDVHRGLELRDRDVLAVDDCDCPGGDVAARAAAAAATGQQRGAQQAGAQCNSCSRASHQPVVVAGTAVVAAVLVVLAGAMPAA